MNENIIASAANIIMKKTGGGNKGFCTLTLMDLDDYPTSTTISVSKADGIKWMTFCTGRGIKAERINRNNKACVCFNSEEYHISLVGTIEEITDLDVKKEMWYEGLENNFSGYDDPDLYVLKFTTQRYNLLVDWQSAKGNLE